MKDGMLEKKLKLDSEMAVLIRERVASTNTCLFCMDANRWAAINKAGVDAAKLDALNDYQTSPLFSDSERAALAFATELTADRHVGADTLPSSPATTPSARSATSPSSSPASTSTTSTTSA
jgi:alkylhydroperoxidase family enzyme